MAGAVGHISCEMIVDMNTEVVRVMSTIQEFSDPAVVIEDASERLLRFPQQLKVFLIDLFVIFLTNLLFRQRFDSNGSVCGSCPQAVVWWSLFRDC